jgi:cytochrome o ubiquinol oxidase operon protein cyoD
MTYPNENLPHQVAHTVPGDEDRLDKEIASGLRSYTIGLGLAIVLTAISFSLPGSTLLWGPAVPVALIVFGIAQMGVHLIFFLHITTAPDSTNNVLALVFGVFIVALLIGGSIWIMASMNHNMMSAMPMRH